MSSSRKLPSIEGFDDETATEIQTTCARVHRARAKPSSTARRKRTRRQADDLAEIEGMTTAMLVALGENDVKTSLEDFAELRDRRPHSAGTSGKVDENRSANAGFLSGFEHLPARRCRER